MKNYTKQFTVGAVLGLAMMVSGAGQAHATPFLDGKMIETTVEFQPTMASSTIVFGPDTKTVVAGVEYMNVATAFGLPAAPNESIDFGNTSIIIEIITAGHFGVAFFNGLHFFDVLGAIPNWTVLVSVNDFGALVDFDANNIFINVQDLTVKVGDRLVLDIAAAPVPEPSTMLLFGSGLAGLVAWRVRKQHA